MLMNFDLLRIFSETEKKTIESTIIDKKNYFGL